MNHRPLNPINCLIISVQCVCGKKTLTFTILVKGKENIIDDFRIVACASFKGWDIIVSDNKKTMRGSEALSVYGTVAVARSLRYPNFIDYQRLKDGLKWRF